MDTNYSILATQLTFTIDYSMLTLNFVHHIHHSLPSTAINSATSLSETRSARDPSVLTRPSLSSSRLPNKRNSNGPCCQSPLPKLLSVSHSTLSRPHTASEPFDELRLLPLDLDRQGPGPNGIIPPRWYRENVAAPKRSLSPSSSSSSSSSRKSLVYFSAFEAAGNLPVLCSTFTFLEKS